MLATLLQCLYQGEVDLPKDIHFYDQCLKEIDEASLWGQVYHLLKRSDMLEQFPPSFRSSLIDKYEFVLAQNLFVNHRQRKILTYLDNNSVRAVPLKGTRFAERYFGHIGARGTSDIDILVHPKDLRLAVECLRKLGFNGPLRYNPLHFHCVMWKAQDHQRLPPLFVEVHWDIVIRNTSYCMPEWLWKESLPLAPYRHVRELSTTQTFYAICLHGSNHRLESMKYVLDIAHMLYRFHEEIDLIEILEQSIDDKTMRRIGLVLDRVYRIFPGLHGVKPIPSEYCKGNMLIKLCGFKVPLLLVDDWKSRYLYLRQWFVPPRDVALWHMRDDPRATVENVYPRFYRRRARHFFERVAKTSKGDNRHV